VAPVEKDAYTHLHRHRSMSFLIADHVRKTYRSGETTVEAVTDVSLTVSRGEFVAVVGPSGCGKSTLLHLCGGMDHPSSGSVILEGTRLEALDDDGLTRVRRERIGFVFQFFNLLPTLTLGENIELPLLLAGADGQVTRRRARELAERMGVAQRWSHYPPQLSGGEMQRAAIARAVIHAPALLLADEPTGNLDTENGDRVLGLLRDLHLDGRLTILLATHAPDLAAAAGRVVHLRDGRVLRVEERRPPSARSRAAL
jgi:putative ABC transport system ATP-binding protein